MEQVFEIIWFIIKAILWVLGFSVVFGICFLIVLNWIVGGNRGPVIDGTDEDDRMYYW